MLKSIRNRKWVLAGAAALLWLLICLLVTPVYTTVTLTYAEDPSGEVITTVFAGPGENVSASEAKSRVVNSGVAPDFLAGLKVWKPLFLKADRSGGSGLQ